MSLQISHMRAEILFDTMFAVCTADTALLHTGMETLNCLKMEAVDVSLTKLEFTYTAYSTVDIVCKDRRSKTIFAIVSPCYHLIEIIPNNDWEHRTESLLMDYIHLLTAIVEQSRCIEIAFFSYTMSATKHLGTLLNGLSYFSLNAFKRTLFHEGAHVDIIGRERIAYFHGFKLFY